MLKQRRRMHSVTSTTATSTTATDIMATAISAMGMSMPTTTSMTRIAATTTRSPMLMQRTPEDAPPRVVEAMASDDARALYRLLTWLSPAFPVGAFSYSSGIEWSVDAGDIVDAATLRDWLDAMLTHGPDFCDGVLLAHTYRAAAAGDTDALRGIAELAAAFAPSRERHLETLAQGRAFVEIARSAWTSARLDALIAACDGPIVYPVAVGIVSASHGIALAATLHGFLHAVVSNWISAGARLIPLGQTDSQRVLAALEPAVTATAARALGASLDDIGSATFRADLASMRHETQYTRLFRS